MIDFTRMTGNEREVLHAALKAYDSLQASRARRLSAEVLQADVRWRRFVVAELLERIDK